jgi:hypothetical protein
LGAKVTGSGPVASNRKMGEGSLKILAPRRRRRRRRRSVSNLINTKFIKSVKI